MKKQILITINESSCEMHTKGEITQIEIIGALRFFEKDVWLKIQQKNHIQKQNNNEKI